MKAFNVLLSILVSVVLFLLLFEGGLRLLKLGPPNTLQRHDAAVGWSKKANHEVRRKKHAFDITIATNEQGLRDDSMASPAKPAGATRVLVLGDSFTLGYTVDREDLFVDLLEGRWQNEGRNVDVLNVGTEAWSTDQEVRWLMEYGAAFEPDLVVLASYDNDIFWNGQSAYTDWPKPRFRADGTLETTEPLPDHTTGWRRTTALGRMISGRQGNPTFTTPGGVTVPADFSVLMVDAPAVLGDALARTRGALVALREACADLDADLLVAPIPSHACADPAMAKRFGEEFLKISASDWDPCRPVDLVLGWCAELGIASVDARPALRAATTDGDCYFSFFEKDREWHFNPRGNHTFAEVLYGEIGRLGLLPAKTSEAEFAAIAATSPGGGVPGWLILYGVLFVVLTGLYFAHYKDEKPWQPPLKVGALLAAIFLIFFGATWLVEHIPTGLQRPAIVLLILVILGFVGWKLGRRLATIGELLRAFVLRGHWYLMPLVVVLLTVGSLLVVAASSPLVAPFIYTLF